MPIILCALAAATPAAAQHEEWGRADNLVLYRGAAGCTASGITNDGIAVEVREYVGGALTFRVARKGWRFAPGRTYTIRLTGTRGGDITVEGPARGFRDAEGRRLAVPITAPQLAAANWGIDVFDGAWRGPIASIDNRRKAEPLLMRRVLELAHTDRGSEVPDNTACSLPSRWARVAPARCRGPPDPRRIRPSFQMTIAPV